MFAEMMNKDIEYLTNRDIELNIIKNVQSFFISTIFTIEIVSGTRIWLSIMPLGDWGIDLHINDDLSEIQVSIYHNIYDGALDVMFPISDPNVFQKVSNLCNEYIKKFEKLYKDGEMTLHGNKPTTKR